MRVLAKGINVKQMINKYVYLLQYGSFSNYLMSDLIHSKDVLYCEVNEPKANPFINFIRKCHTSYKINKVIDIPFQNIWYKNILSQIDNNTAILVDTMTLTKLKKGFFEQLKVGFPQCKLVLVVLDSMHAHSIHLDLVRDRILTYPWDLVLSYDKNDCREFGFHPLGEVYYSKLPMPEVQNSDIANALYFVGSNKSSRNKLAVAISKEAERCGVDIYFDLIGMNSPINVKGIHLYNKWIPYENVLQNFQASNCILEILQDDQYTQSIRYYEAVCYNKKLLTNNDHVKELSFYDPRYMKVFHKVEDIDWEWVSRREPIDYGYKGEFSPVHIKEIVEEYFGQK